VNDGLNAKLSWTAVVNNNAVQYRIKAGTVWSSGTLIADVKTTAHYILMTTITTYNFMIKALDSLGRESTTAATASLSGAPSVAVGSNLIGADDYLSSTFFYRNRLESLDGLYTGNVTLSSDGYALLSNAVFPYNSSVIKRITSPRPAFSFANAWSFTASVLINSGTGANLYSGASVAGSGFNVLLAVSASADDQFGLLLKWNTGTSKIDIYARCKTSFAGITASLITSINDTGLSCLVECVFTPAVNMVATVTVSGVSYSATVTTNLPDGAFTGGGGDVLQIINSDGSGNTAIRIYEWTGNQK